MDGQGGVLEPVTDGIGNDRIADHFAPVIERQLEHENERLKKLLAERDLDIEILKEVAAKKW